MRTIRSQVTGGDIHPPYRAARPVTTGQEIFEMFERSPFSRQTDRTDALWQFRASDIPSVPPTPDDVMLALGGVVVVRWTFTGDHTQAATIRVAEDNKGNGYIMSLPENIEGAISAEVTAEYLAAGTVAIQAWREEHKLARTYTLVVRGKNRTVNVWLFGYPTPDSLPEAARNALGSALYDRWVDPAFKFEFVKDNPRDFSEFKILS